MFKKLICALFVLALLAPPSGAATTKAPRKSHQGGYSYDLCDGEDTAGSSVVCGNSSGTEYFAIVDDGDEFLVEFSETNTPGSTCDIRGYSQDGFNSRSSSMAGEGFLIATVSASLPPYEWDHPVYAVFADCDIVAGGTVEVDLTVVKYRR